MMNSYVITVIAILIFLLILARMFKKMTNSEADRVIKGFTVMGNLLPFSKIAGAITAYFKSKNPINET